MAMVRGCKDNSEPTLSLCLDGRTEGRFVAPDIVLGVKRQEWHDKTEYACPACEAHKPTDRVQARYADFIVFAAFDGDGCSGAAPCGDRHVFSNVLFCLHTLGSKGGLT
mmetsp:Transcript_28380/g.38357  ORF Transcript_28380/g.38357 Transcript_28380/m.38357 type:complete len:109 (-) Transcript_28380:76-402(-)